MHEQLLEDMHVCVEACRRSADGLHRQVWQFVHQYVRYDDKHKDDSERQLLWRCLGVPPDLLERLAHVDPRWDASKQVLLVSARVREDPDAFAEVRDRVAFLLQWRKWSDSRWAAVGPSSRLMLGSLVAGGEKIVAMLQQNGKNNERYSHVESVWNLCRRSI